MTKESQEKLERYIAKLSLSGIGLEIQYPKRKDDFPILKSITYACAPESTQLNISSLNNGDILFEDNQITKFRIDFNDINYTIQSRKFIDSLLLNKEIETRITHSISYKKFIEIESRVIELTKKKQTDSEEIASMIKNFTTIIAWLEFKADQMLWAYGYTHIVDDYSTLDYLYDFYNEVSLVLSMIRETDITSKDESTRKLIIRTIALMRQAIGTSLDIFSGDFKEACDYQSGCGVTIPKLTVHEKQIIDNVTFQLNTISSTAFE